MKTLVIEYPKEIINGKEFGGAKQVIKLAHDFKANPYDIAGDIGGRDFQGQNICKHYIISY